MTYKNRAKFKKLEAQLRQHKAHDLGTLHRAKTDVKKCGQEKYMASGLMVSIQNLAGDDVVNEFMVQDGFSQELIEALVAEIERTMKIRVDYIPSIQLKGAHGEVQDIDG